MDHDCLCFRPGGEIVGGAAIAVPAGIRGEAWPDFIEFVYRSANHILVVAATVIDGARRIVDVYRVSLVRLQFLLRYGQPPVKSHSAIYRKPKTARIKCCDSMEIPFASPHKSQSPQQLIQVI